VCVCVCVRGAASTVLSSVEGAKRAPPAAVRHEVLCFFPFRLFLFSIVALHRSVACAAQTTNSDNTEK
jgi:hypothetical protein